MNQPEQHLKTQLTQIAQRILKPRIHSMEQQAHFPKDLWQDLGQHALLGIMMPEALGGLNGSAKTLAMAIETLSACYPPAALSFIAHCALCMHQIASHGSPKQQQQYLPAMIQGQSIGALAISEYEAGSDAMNMNTQATPVPGGYQLSGKKAWITNAIEADIFVVYAHTGQNTKGQANLTAFILERKQPGVRVGPALDKMAMRGANTAELLLDDCFVPEDQMLGKPNQGAAIMMQGLDFERIMLAAGALGIIKGCADEVLPYVQQRRQFNSSLANMPLIQSKLADIYVAYSSSKHMLHAMVEAYQHNTLTRQDAAACFLHVADQASKTAEEALQCFGANGLMNAFPVSRFYRDAKLYQIGGGTQEIRRVLIAREWLKTQTQTDELTTHENA